MKKNQWIWKTVLLLGSVVFTLILAEQAYRFYLFGWDSFSIAKMNSIRPMGCAGLVEPADHPEIVYQLKPNLDTYFKLKPVRTNSRGLADKEYPMERSDDIVRICVVGDSYTMPAGVTTEDAYHTILENRLNAETSNVHFEVINFGVGGYSLRQYLGVIQHRIDAWSPDMILIGFCPYNDHIPLPKKIFGQPYTPKPVMNTFFHSYLKAQITGKKRLDGSVSFTRRQTQYMQGVFSIIHKYTVYRKTPILVMLLSHEYNQEYSNNLRELVTGAGLDFLDLSQAFAQSNPKDYYIYPIDGHPDEAAHRIFAEELYRYLSTNSRLQLDIPPQ